MPVLVILLVGLILRIALLPTSSVWLDEAFSIRAAKMDVMGIFDTLYHDRGEPIYYLLLKMWMRAVGDTDWALSLLSVLLSTSSIYIVYLLGKEYLESHQAGLCAALLAALSSHSLFHATAIRFYPLLELLTPLSYLLLFRHLKGRTGYAVYGLSVLAGLLTHTYFLFVALSHLMIGRARLWRPVLFVLFLYLPWTVVLVHQLQVNASATIEPVATAFGALSLFNLSFFKKLGLPNSLVLLGWPIFCFGMWRTRQLGEAFLVSVGLPILISLWEPIFLIGRYDTIALCLVQVMAAALIVLLPRSLQACVFALVLLASMGLLKWRINEGPGEDKVVSSELAGQLAPSDRVLFTGLGWLAPKYYLDYHGVDYTDLGVFPNDFESHPGYVDYSAYRNGLNREASELVERLSQDEGRLVVFYTAGDGPMGRLLKPLQEELEKSFVLEEVRPVRQHVQGPFYNQVLVYRKR